MHCNAAELFADDLTLSGVNTRANVNAEFPNRVNNRPSTADCTRGTIKRGQEAVARGIYFATSMFHKLFTNQGVMLSEKLFPSSVAEFDKSLCSRNNIREQYSGEYAITLGFNVAALTGQERFNLSED
jgi:hypothetical protein